MRLRDNEKRGKLKLDITQMFAIDSRLTGGSVPGSLYMRRRQVSAGTEHPLGSPATLW